MYGEWVLPGVATRHEAGNLGAGSLGVREGSKLYFSRASTDLIEGDGSLLGPEGGARHARGATLRGAPTCAGVPRRYLAEG